MRRPLRITLAATLLAVLGVLCWLVWGRNAGEPVYAGKPLSHWLKALDARPRGGSGISRRDANRAIDQAGTNGFPVYLDMLKAVDPPLKTWLIAQAGKQHVVKIQFTTAPVLHQEAEYAFGRLGARSKAAVPALIRLYRSTSDPDSKAAIARVLGSIGPAAKEALPLLWSEPATTNASLRIHIASAIQNIDGTGAGRDWAASPMRTTVQDGLRDLDTRRQADAARQIYTREPYGRWGADGAVSLLLELVGQPRTNSYWIHFALEQLNPDAAAGAVPADTLPAGDPPPRPADSTGHAESTVASGNSGRLLSVGEWSEPSIDRVHRLRGRLLVYAVTANGSAGRTWRNAMVFLELQEVTRASFPTPATLLFDCARGFQPKLRDAQGGLLQPVFVEERAGPKASWVIVPLDGSVRFPAGVFHEITGASSGAAQVQFGSHVWSITAADTNDYFLSATFAPPKALKSPLDYDLWDGTLKLPPVRIPGGKP